MTEPLRPTTAVNSVWDISGVTRIDDNVLTGAAGDGVSVQADRNDDNEEQIYGGWLHATASTVAHLFSTVTSITIHFRSHNEDDALSIGARLKIDSVWTSSQTLTTGASSSFVWDSVTFLGSWDPADIDAIEVGFTTPSMSSPDTLNLDVAYLDIDGTPLPTVDIVPDGDGTNSGFTSTGANFWDEVNHNTGTPDDAKYITLSGQVGSIFLALEDMPANFGVAVSATAYSRHRISSGSTHTLRLQIFKADESTALTNETSFGGTTSWATNSHSLNITGDTDKTSWDGARIKISSTDTTGDLDLSEFMVKITHTTTGPAPSSSSILLRYYSLLSQAA